MYDNNDYNKENNIDNQEDMSIEERYSKEYNIDNEEKIINEDNNKKKKRGFRGSLISYIALALVASIIGGLVSNYIPIMGSTETSENSNQYTAQPVSISTTDDLNTVSAVVKKSMPSVVGITTLASQQMYPYQLERDVEGLGSGIIVNSDGYILTNSHVVADGQAKDIQVLFENGDKVQGTVLWNDPKIDLAIVKVDVTNLPVADLGNSDELEVGELAIAIGNPLGLEFERTVTSGIISGLQRSVAIERGIVIDDLIQTDASINPGNSGGPLLNKNGEVIGINTAKANTGEGLGFAIPINKTKNIIEEVIEKGNYKKVELGIAGMDIVEFQRRNGVDLGFENGVIILEIVENSIAEKVGLQQMDIILKIDNKKVESMDTLRKSLYDYQEGDKVNLEIIRNKEKMNIEVIF